MLFIKPRSASWRGETIKDKVRIVCRYVDGIMNRTFAYKVVEGLANEIFDEAENRLHAQKAVLVKLMK